jgi:hypothetical protein
MATESEILTKLNDLLDGYADALSVSGASKVLSLDRATSGDGGLVAWREAGGERFRAGQLGGSTEWRLQRSPTGADVDYVDVLTVDRSTGVVTLAGVLAPSGGSAAAPGIAFAGDADTGLYSAAGDTVGLATGGVSRLLADGSGNVLIGRTVATLGGGNGSTLQVGDGAGGAGITIHGSTGSDLDLQFADGTVGDASYRGLIRYSHAVDAMAFWTAAGERARIDSAGRLLVGTSVSGASPLRVVSLPTSAAGLSSGDIWNDGGTLKVA